METEITPEQKAQLATWAGKRDALLLEISSLQIAKDKLETINKDLANSSSEIEKRMNQVLGRIEELEKKEVELPLLISREISNLKIEKSALETKISDLNNIINILVEKKASLDKDVVFAESIFDKINGRTAVLEEITNETTRLNIENERFVKGLVEELKTTLTELIDINKKNVSETNLVVDKVPKMLVELQKHGLIKNKI